MRKNKKHTTDNHNAIKKPYPRYIPEKPIGNDLFEGKPQEKIADSIAKSIEQNLAPFKIIGIEGEWGSGKSNVIKIIEEQLKESHYIYTYNTWGHQEEDSHRRAFLEELTDKLIKEKLITTTTTRDGKKIKWTEALKFLLSNKKETSTKNVPKLGGGTIAAAATVAFTPLMVQISNNLGDIELFYKIIISGSIFISSLMILFIYSLCNKKYSFLEYWKRLLYIYIDKKLETTKEEIISNLQPSVKEFKEWLNGISISLLNGKKLIIVYDNMDRLPSEKLMDIWASIYTFFAECDDYKNIQLIIPFDRNHLSRAFGDNQNEYIKDKGKHTDERSHTDERNSNIDEYINKTFSVIYRVSPPVLTDWKNYFEIKFKEAFSDTKDNELKIVISVFDTLKPYFTPRDIIVFMNELVQLSLIWKDDIPLSHLAYFILQKKEICNNPRQEILSINVDNLESKEKLRKIPMIIDNIENLQNNVAACFYNVPKYKASQVLMQRDLERILIGNSNKDINIFIENIHFLDILEEVLVVNSKSIDLPITTEKLDRLDTSKIAGGYINDRLQSIWGHLVKLQIGRKLSTQSFLPYHQVLLRNCSPKLTEDLVKYLVKQIVDFGKISDGNNFSGKLYFIALEKLRQFLQQEKIYIDICTHLKDKEVSADIFLEYLAVAGEYYELFKLSTDSQELDDYLVEKISDLELNEMDNIKFLPKNILPKLKSRIESIISDDRLTYENFNKIIQTYKGISPDKPLGLQLEFSQINTLHQDINDPSQPGYYDLLAMHLVHSSVNKIIDNRIIQEVAEVIEYYKDYGSLLLLTVKRQDALLIAVVKYLTRNPVDESKMAIEEVLPKFPDIIECWGNEKEDRDNNEEPEGKYSEILYKRIASGWEKYLTISDTDKLLELIPDYSLYELSTTIDNKMSQKINRATIDYLRSQTKENIIEEWEDEGSYYFNTLYFFMKKNKCKLPNNALNAIKNILVKIAEQELEIPEEKEEEEKEKDVWNFFVDQVKEIPEIQPKIKDIKDMFINGQANITPKLFIFFAPFFEQYEAYLERAHDITRIILNKVFDDADCMRYIIEKSATYIPIIKNAKKDAADFKNKVREKSEKNTDNLKLKEFLAKLKTNNSSDK